MIRIFRFFFLASLYLLVTCPAIAQMTILTEEYPPFNFTEQGKLTGATTQVVKEILRRLGSSDTIEVLPWARGYERLNTEADVVLFTTAHTPERASLFHWVGPLYSFRLGFYAKKGNTLNIDSLEAAKQVGGIATYRSDFRGQILKSLGFTNLENSNTPESNIRKLVSGRVDLWFFDNIGAPKVALKAGIDPSEIEEVFTYQEHFSYIAISKQTSPAIVYQWQKILDEMKEDGTFWWLSQKWMPPGDIMVSERQTNTDQPSSVKFFTEDSPPSSYEEKGQLTGLSVEIIQEVFRRIGKPEKIELVPWARGYKLTLADANTALFATSRIPDREEFFSWVGPLYRQHWGFYRWQGSQINASDLEAAKQVERIGTYHLDAKMQYLQAAGFDNLVPTSKNITNIKHLKQGNINLWLSSDFNMPYLAREAGESPDQLVLTYAFHPVENYIAFSKETSPHVIRLWQNVLDEMKSDGSYKWICRKYNYEP